MGKIHIGTSGWSYDHWKDSFYKETPKSDWFKFYASHFGTVEINSSFYRLPNPHTVKKWEKESPKSFVFSVKASRYITHVKRLKEPKEGVKIFLKSITPLKSKLGPILFQLPPNFKVDLERLEKCLSVLPKGNRYTFEFRHDSWFIQEVYELLKKNKIALCITDLEGKLSPVEVTAPFIYIRLHGPQRAYQGRYSHQKLTGWAKRIRKWLKEALDVYVYFDNDEKGYAVKDTLKLIEYFKEENT